MDAYSVLGVSPSATQEEIKSAFRKIALKHHPDRNPDNQQSEDIFKSASSAYELIGSPDSRREYDESRRPRPSRTNYRNRGPDFGDVFQNVNINFGQNAGNTWEELFGSFQGKKQKPFTIRARVDVTLDDLTRSSKKSFVLDGQSVEFTLPAGLRHGMTLVVPVGGNQELHASINVLPHPVFSYDGDDVYCHIKVPIDMAIKGGEVNVRTLDRDLNLKISPFTDSHKKLRVKNYGLLRQDGTRGSLIYEVKLSFDDVDVEKKELLRSVL